MEESHDIESLISVLKELKNRHEGQYMENIVRLCQQKYEWDEDKTKGMLEKCVDKGYLSSVTKNSKISYRILTETIGDLNKSVEEIRESLSSNEKEIPAAEMLTKVVPSLVLYTMISYRSKIYL